ncbi:MAG: winged helix DNA-binding domain-containing protein [Streptosporangiales bacterium]|nr:winged helix DNA-binding domain-containing protein [Streptosporangiales bacterium]
MNNLTRRLPEGSYVDAAFAGLQVTASRDALLGLHARVESCAPAAWEDPGLIQTYSPRAAVYVLPKRDLGVFTVGRLPLDPDARARIDRLASRVRARLDGGEVRGAQLPDVRPACASGRIAVRWTTSALYVRELPRPDVDEDAARLELCRRHVHAFGPTTPAAFAWWAGVPGRDARRTRSDLAGELTQVELDGRRAWILAADEPAVRRAEPMVGVRLLVAPDLRLLGQDRTGLFVGPGLAQHSPAQDTYHPNGLLVDGRVGPARGRVDVRATEPLPTATRDAVVAEALSLPVPGVEMSVRVNGESA